MPKSSSHKIIKSYDTGFSTIEFWDNGIVFINMQNNVEMDVDKSVRQYTILNEHYNGKDRFKVLVESGQFTSITPEGREFATRPESNEMTSAIAVIIHSMAQRLIVNYLMYYLGRQKTKMKAFDNRSNAVKWLLSYKPRKK